MKEIYSDEMTEGGEFTLGMMSTDPFMTMKKMKKSNHNKNNNQRRFSDEQIKSLELMFESETRLEPRKKVQLARELGLQPRQVAIWFQNKRARWKSKQLESEYNILRQDYDNLASQSESLKKEKQSLVSELQRLRESMEKAEEGERQCCGGQAVVALSSTDHESENEENRKCEPEEIRPEMEIHEKGHHGLLCDYHRHHHHYGDEDGYNNSIKREYFAGFGEEPDHLMNIVEPADSCLTSSDDWRGFKSDNTLLNQTSSNYPWWDFGLE